MRYQILIAAFCLVFIGCKKNSGKPVLKLKSVSSTVVPHGAALIFTFTFSNLAGDASDSIFIRQVTSNCSEDSLRGKEGVPVFTSSNNEGGTISVSFVNGTDDGGYIPLLTPQCSAQDSSVFQFVLQDRFANMSDTVTSSVIVLTQN